MKMYGAEGVIHIDNGNTCLYLVIDKICGVKVEGNGNNANLAIITDGGEIVVASGIKHDDALTVAKELRDYLYK